MKEVVEWAWLKDLGINPDDAKCYNCGSPRSPILWFCSECTDAKEAAYAACRASGIGNYADVMIKREEYLTKIRKSKNTDETVLAEELGEENMAFIRPVRLKENE